MKTSSANGQHPIATSRQTVNWQPFFAPGTPVVALPSWSRPRLFVPAGTLRQRWRGSAFYPAFRVQARLARTALRLLAAANVAVARTPAASSWTLAEFVGEAIPGVSYATVRVGTPGPIQKVTVQLRDRTHAVVGYVKCAEKPMARVRLRQEYDLLKQLPAGVGPEPLKYGRLGDYDALLLSSVSGTLLSPYLNGRWELDDLLDRLVRAERYPVDEHPGIVALLSHCTFVRDEWLAPLRGQAWPVVIQHGDLAPWNVLRGPDGRLCAVDWEQGTLSGFPYLDHCYYVLQVAALMHRWPPHEAAAYGVRHLVRLGLPEPQAQALVRLTAADAYGRADQDGMPPDDSLQRWRRALCEMT